MLDIRNEEVFFSGFFKCITDDNPGCEGGVAVENVGPLTEWWISGYGEGDNLVLGVSTETAHYYLTEASPYYSTFLNKIKEKAFVSKVVIAALFQAYENQEELEYESLLAILEATEVPKHLEQ
jgi:hypothetical protein